MKEEMKDSQRSFLSLYFPTMEMMDKWSVVEILEYIQEPRRVPGFDVNRTSNIINACASQCSEVSNQEPRTIDSKV